MLEWINWEQFATLIQAGAGMVALWIGVQIRAVVKNHETRIEKLEAAKPVRRSRRKGS